MNCSRSVIRWLVNPAEGREEWFFLFSICASEQIQTSNLLLSAQQVKTLCKLDTAEIPEPGKLVQTVIGEFRDHSEPDILDTQWITSEVNWKESQSERVAQKEVMIKNCKSPFENGG